MNIIPFPYVGAFSIEQNINKHQSISGLQKRNAVLGTLLHNN